VTRRPCLTVLVLTLALPACSSLRSYPAFEEMRIVKNDEPVSLRAFNRGSIQQIEGRTGALVQAIPVLVEIDPGVRWNALTDRIALSRASWEGSTTPMSVRFHLIGRPPTRTNGSGIDPGALTDYPFLVSGDWEEARRQQATFLEALEIGGLRMAPMLLVCDRPELSGTRCFDDGDSYVLRFDPESDTGQHVAEFPFHTERRSALLSLAIGLTAIVLFLGGSAR
jgi:hypothetical protein